MARLLDLLAIVITLLYPVAIGFGQGVFEPRLLAVLLLVLVLARLPALKVRPTTYGWLGGTVLLLAYGVWANALLPLKLYPVLVNFVLLGIFAYSLIHPPSLVERIARAGNPDLPAAAVA
jgi:uncharacterized membrane protein